MQLTRDFGSTMMKRECSGLAPEPHVAVVELCEDDEFLVIGSDGLFEVFTNHRQLVKTVKDTLRATGSVDETVKVIVRDVVKSVNSNDNVTMLLVLFNQFGVITAHAGGAGGWRGFAAASKPVLRAPEGMRSPPCPMPPYDADGDHEDTIGPLSSALYDHDHNDSETLAVTPQVMLPKQLLLPSKPLVNHHLNIDGIGHHHPMHLASKLGHTDTHVPSPLRTVAMPTIMSPPAVQSLASPHAHLFVPPTGAAVNGTPPSHVLGNEGEPLSLDHAEVGISVPAM